MTLYNTNSAAHIIMDNTKRNWCSNYFLTSDDAWYPEILSAC